MFGPDEYVPYALFDRHCRTQTTIDKLKKLRQ